MTKEHNQQVSVNIISKRKKVEQSSRKRFKSTNVSENEQGNESTDLEDIDTTITTSSPNYSQTIKDMEEAMNKLPLESINERNVVKQAISILTNRLVKGTYISNANRTQKLLDMDCQDALETLMNMLEVDMEERLRQLQLPRHFNTEFVQRDEVKKEIVSLYEANMKAFNNNQYRGIIKQDVFFGDAMGGAGQGKTRTCHEAQRILQSNFTDISFYYFYWDSNNGLGLATEETAEGHCIGLRVFLILAGANIAKLEEKCKVEVEKLYKLFRIEQVLQYVSKKIYRNADPGDKCSTIILAIDEYQTFLDRKGMWTKPLKDILSYMCSTDGPNKNILRDKLCIVPIIAGLLPADMNFEATGYNPVRFSYRPFTYSTIETIMNQRLAPDLFEKALQTNEARRFWYEVGLVPRILIDYVIGDSICEADTFDKDNLVELWKRVLKVVNEKNGPIQNDDTQTKLLLDYVLSNTPAPLKEAPEWLQQLKKRGVVYWGPKNQLYVSFHHFRELVSTFYPLLEQKLPLIAELFTWEYFETFGVQCFCSKINCLSSRKETATLKELFPGAKIPEALIPLKLELPKECDVIEDNVPFIDQNLRVNVKILDTDIEMERQTVHRTKARCTAIDAFWVTKLKGDSEHKEVMCCFQYNNCEDPRSKSYKNPPQWANETYKMLKHIDKLSKYRFIFILVTNGTIAQSLREPRRPLKSISDVTGQQNLIVISQDCASEYFPPNLLPYYQFIDDLPENDRLTMSQVESLDIVPQINLDKLSYTSLQQLAKKNGVKANLKKEHMIGILKKLQKEGKLFEDSTDEDD